MRIAAQSAPQPRNQCFSREGHALAAADGAREVRAAAKATRRPWQPPRRLAAQLGAASLPKLTELADASSGLPGTGFGLPGTGFGLPGTGFGLPWTGFGMPWTGFGLPGTGFRLGVDRTGILMSLGRRVARQKAEAKTRFERIKDKVRTLIRAVTPRREFSTEVKAKTRFERNKDKVRTLIRVNSTWRVLNRSQGQDALRADQGQGEGALSGPRRRRARPSAAFLLGADSMAECLARADGGASPAVNRHPSPAPAIVRSIAGAAVRHPLQRADSTGERLAKASTHRPSRDHGASPAVNRHTSSAPTVARSTIVRSERGCALPTRRPTLSASARDAVRSIKSESLARVFGGSLRRFWSAGPRCTELQSTDLRSNGRVRTEGTVPSTMRANWARSPRRTRRRAGDADARLGALRGVGWNPEGAPQSRIRYMVAARNGSIICHDLVRVFDSAVGLAGPDFVRVAAVPVPGGPAHHHGPSLFPLNNMK